MLLQQTVQSPLTRSTPAGRPFTRVRASKASAPGTVVGLQSELATPEAFEPFGQLIGPTDDGKQFDATDAQLVLDKGTPRFYIMRLPRRGLEFNRITYHANCTQCLGGLQSSRGTSPWYIVVAAPTGSVAQYPTQQQLKAFKIPHGVFVKFKDGTW
eukprot:GHUV01026555.1.p1 GENE.GHUV01026555.1~~GHUV01026555.1.p1  ORF type:complete len:156 (+),score=20.55 GHUV01026555.1:110-577(+)